MEQVDAPLPPAARKRRSRRGLAVVALLTLAVAGTVLFLQARAVRPSSSPLLGEEVPITSSRHVETASELEIAGDVPPAGGPHFVRPTSAGIYNSPLNDGNVIHSLEHGMIWVSYRADLISSADLERLVQIAQDHQRDVVLSPRPETRDAAYVVSWGRRMKLSTPIDVALLRQFITTNRDRSPEPGLR